MREKRESAIAEAKRATELNPLSSFDQQHYAWILYHNGRLENAIAQARQTLSNEPNFSHALCVLSWILRHAGRFEESLDLGKRAVELSPGTPWMECNLAASYAALGETVKARELLRELENKSSENTSRPFVWRL
jgi:tetratricopeptide (TPR) repeat protein